MTTKTRRSRTQRATPELILATARSIARTDGWPAVTIRRIADELHYTSPIIYEHFQNKDDALLAVMRQGFVELEATLSEANCSNDEPTERLIAIAEAYWRFAQAQPEVYQIMHSMGGVVLDAAETAKGAQAVCEIALAAVNDWAKATDTAIPAPLEATELLWASLHGITCLGLAGRMHNGEAAMLGMVRRVARELLAGWRACYSNP